METDVDEVVEAWDYASTGHLPDSRRIEGNVQSAYQQFKDNSEGETSHVYPALAKVQPDLFGIALVKVDGSTFTIGDAQHEFTIMSVSKPFVFALVCEVLGHDALHELVGVNATGMAFNSMAALERSPDGRTNPMVNSGAIATTSLVPGENRAAKWAFILQGLSAFAGRDLTVNEAVYRSALESNFHNRAIASYLQSVGRIYSNAADATNLYTRQCALSITAEDLAVMGATLADGGVNPITRRRVVSATVCRYTLAIMSVAGLYESSGDWLYDIGLPGKSGIGGGIVTVSPGKAGLGTFAPRLDSAGNSVKGQRVAAYLSQHLGLDLYISAPAQ